MELLKRFKDWAFGLLPINNGTLDISREAYDRSRTQQKKVDYEVVKSRPLPLEERYQVVQERRVVQAVFDQLTTQLVNLCEAISDAARSERSGRIVLRQIGVTDDGRPYIYMKPMSEDGWLVEMGPAGWRISNAEQIVSREMFMRSHSDPWDVVTVWGDPQGQGLTRIKSHRFGRELMTAGEYERRVCEHLRDVFTTGSRH